MGTLPKSGTVDVVSAGSPEQVWDVLSDVTRTGDWSHETTGATWIDGASAAVAGARFKGTNRQGRTRWSRACEVVAADRPRTWAFRTVPSRLYPDSTIWTFELTPEADGTRVTQHFEVVRLHPLLDRLFYALIPAHRDRTEALRGDLQRLAELAAETTPATESTA